ncbi:hypothetical protein O181_017366 [Austropuccinia psidii MF-1]|uniref:Uncharacterized protein n=1 Tax=Austropuccinia psidii MF-1 TaxID=1389203 RepID=A0A9Q3C7G1_9BASI|nr:hypothetical protein [Austropuccinia psidii MF-1]
MELDSEVEFFPQKGKGTAKSTQGSAISQREVPEMPITSETELQLSMSHSNRYKSHSEGSNRHIHEPIQGKGLGNVATNPPRSDELLAYLVKVPQRGVKKGRIPNSFYQKASIKETSPRWEEEQEKEVEETIFHKLQDPKNPKRCHGQNLYGIQGKRGTKNETTPIPKEITLFPDVVNTLE